MAETRTDAQTGGEARHVCCVFRGRRQFAPAAAAFLCAGRARGDRLIYVADGDLDALLEDLRPLGSAEELRCLQADGGLVVRAVADVYQAGGVEPAAQVAEYRRLTDEAQADGFAGISVAADATALVADEDDRLLFMRYELAVDCFINSSAMRAMCGYDADVLGRATLDMACVHRERQCLGDGPEVGVTGFGGFAVWPDRNGVIVSGEVDVSNADRFRVALAAAADAVPLAEAAAVGLARDEAGSGGQDATARLRVDAGRLSFIDAEGTAALVSVAERLPGSRPLVVADPPRSLRAVVETLGWSDRVVLTRSGA